MVSFPVSLFQIRSDNLLRVLVDKDVVAALAAQLVANQAEAHIDMMADCPSEYTSFEEVENCMSSEHITTSTCQYLDALMEEFREDLIAAVKLRRVTVKSVTMNGDGLSDADVVVE